MCETKQYVDLMKKYRSVIVFCFLIISGLRLCGQSGDTVYIERVSDSLLLKLAELDNEDTLKVSTLVELAILYNTYDVNQSLKYIEEAEQIVAKTGRKSQLAQVHFTSGNIYLNKANYQKALFHYLRTLRIYEELHRNDNVTKCLHNIGVIYSYLNNITMAEKYFKEALVIRLKYNYLDDIGINYTGLGFVAESRKDYEQALMYYKKTLEAGEKIGSKYTICIAYIDIGGVYLKMKKTELAKVYFNRALQISLIQRNYHQLGTIYMSLGEAEMLENNLKQAEIYLTQAEFYAKKAGMRSVMISSYKHLAELYHKQGKNTEAYNKRLLYEQLNDSALNEGTYKQVTELQTTYEIEKKNTEIALLNKDKEIVKTKASRDLLFRNILIITCCFVFVILIFLWRNANLKQQLNKNLKTENVNLVKENLQARYEVLKSKVDPHFLFNSLSTLSSMIIVNKEKAIEFVEHFSSLYRSILSTGDEQLLSLEEEMNITQNYLYLQKGRFGNNLHIDINVKDNSYKKMPSFVIQMVVENAIKHNVISSSNNLFISIEQVGNDIIIENNLQPKFSNVPSMGIGQRNILDRYKLLSDNLPQFIRLEEHYRVVLPLINII